jgi:hypothetical protein
MQSILLKVALAIAIVLGACTGTFFWTRGHYETQYAQLVAATNQAAADQKAAAAKINSDNKEADQNELNSTKALLATATADRDRLLNASTKITSGPVSKACPAPNAVVTNASPAVAGTSSAPSAVQPSTDVSTLSENTLSAVIDTSMDNIAYMLSIYDWNASIAK